MLLTPEPYSYANFGECPPWRWQTKEGADVVPSVRAAPGTHERGGDLDRRRLLRGGGFDQHLRPLQLLGHVEAHAGLRQVFPLALDRLAEFPLRVDGNDHDGMGPEQAILRPLFRVDDEVL